MNIILNETKTKPMVRSFAEIPKGTWFKWGGEKNSVNNGYNIGCKVGDRDWFMPAENRVLKDSAAFRDLVFVIEVENLTYHVELE